jgi:hypothetical protein
MLMPRHESLMPKLPDPDLEQFAQRLAAHVPVINAFRAVVPDHRYPSRQAGAWARRADVHARVLELRAICKGTPISEVPDGFSGVFDNGLTAQFLAARPCEALIPRGGNQP